MTGTARRGRVAAAGAVAVWLLLAGHAAAAESRPTQTAGEPVSYGEYSDAELTELGTQWEALSADERRALLAEVKMRMARDRGRSGILKIRTMRQYGVVRKPDGTTVRVQRRVVRVVPVVPGSRRVTFGTGFENRHDPTSRNKQAPPVQVEPEHRPPIMQASSGEPAQ